MPASAAVDVAPPVGEPAFRRRRRGAAGGRCGTGRCAARRAGRGSEHAEARRSGRARADAGRRRGAAAAAPAEDDPVVEGGRRGDRRAARRRARIIEALDIIGDRIDQVRLVRVFQGETGPHGAVTRGEFHYVIDRVAGQQRRDDRRDDRGGRGGDRGGRGGGGRRRWRWRWWRRRWLRRRARSREAARPRQPQVRREARRRRADDDRPARGEMPRAGIGWQLTAAPRDFSGGPRWSAWSRSWPRWSRWRS